jgi:hypothetical protein
MNTVLLLLVVGTVVLGLSTDIAVGAAILWAVFSEWQRARAGREMMPWCRVTRKTNARVSWGAGGCKQNFWCEQGVTWRGPCDKPAWNGHFYGYVQAKLIRVQCLREPHRVAESDEFKLALARQPQRIAPPCHDPWRTQGVREGGQKPRLSRADFNLPCAD